MTRDQFLAWEERQELRYEFDRFQPLAMTGGTVTHARLQRNLPITIGGRLRGTPSEFYASDLKVETAKGFRYPDGFVACSPVAGEATIVGDPVGDLRGLSDSTEGTDLVNKNQEIASVRRYVVLSQNAVAGTMFERVGDDWVGHLLGAASMIRMPEIAIEVTLAELYDGVELPAAERQPS